MPLDTATTNLLNMLAAGGGKPLHQTPLNEVRPAIRALSQQIGPPVTDVFEVSDRTIRGATGEFGVRIYVPRAPKTDERLPIILFYHGGGWAAGDIDSHDLLARYYSKHADAIVVNVGYRLAPEDKFPAALDDSVAALRWAANHAREFGGDPDRIAVTGDSAGGQLAAVVCQLVKAQGGAPRVAFQALVYPVTDLQSVGRLPVATAVQAAANTSCPSQTWTGSPGCT